MIVTWHYNYDFSMITTSGDNLVNYLLESYRVDTNNAPPMGEKHFQRYRPIV